MMINDMKKKELTEQEMNTVTGGGFMEAAPTDEEVFKKAQELFGTNTGFAEDKSGTNGSW